MHVFKFVHKIVIEIRSPMNVFVTQITKKKMENVWNILVLQIVKKLMEFVNAFQDLSSLVVFVLDVMKDFIGMTPTVFILAV